jgi:hypothetical protein
VQCFGILTFPRVRTLIHNLTRRQIDCKIGVAMGRGGGGRLIVPVCRRVMETVQRVFGLALLVLFGVGGWILCMAAYQIVSVSMLLLYTIRTSNMD